MTNEAFGNYWVEMFFNFGKDVEAIVDEKA